MGDLVEPVEVEGSSTPSTTCSGDQSSGSESRKPAAGAPIGHLERPGRWCRRHRRTRPGSQGELPATAPRSSGVRGQGVIVSRLWGEDTCQTEIPSRSRQICVKASVRSASASGDPATGVQTALTTASADQVGLGLAIITAAQAAPVVQAPSRRPAAADAGGSEGHGCRRPEVRVRRPRLGRP